MYTQIVKKHRLDPRPDTKTLVGYKRVLRVKWRKTNPDGCQPSGVKDSPKFHKFNVICLSVALV